MPRFCYSRGGSSKKLRCVQGTSGNEAPAVAPPKRCLRRTTGEIAFSLFGAMYRRARFSTITSRSGSLIWILQTALV